MASKYNRVPNDYPPLKEDWKRETWKQAPTEVLNEAKKQIDVVLGRRSADGIPMAAHVLNAKRIGDEERNRAIEMLHSAHQSGHLTFAELEARLDWVLAAFTADQLNKIVKDLPEPKPAPSLPVSANERRWPGLSPVAIGVTAFATIAFLTVLIVAVLTVLAIL